MSQSSLKRIINHQEESHRPSIIRLFNGPNANRRRWTLRQFFEGWFRNEHLEREKQAAPGSIRAHLEALNWWEQLTDDPAIEDVTRETLKQLRDKLRNATYTRSPRKGAQRYPLSVSRQNSILTYCRTMLFYAGPEIDKRETAGILDRPAPHITIPKTEGEPKAGFSLRTAREIAQACKQMRTPKITGVMPGAWCYALLCAFCFTGLRRGTVLKLRWSMIQMRDGRPWLVVPNQDVSKTRKGTRVFVHPELWMAIQAIRTQSKYVFSIDYYQSRPRKKGEPRPKLSGDALRTIMHKMQELSCIPHKQWLPPQAWRRTHTDWLVDAGYAAGRSIAQSACDHADAKTTEGFYVDVKNKFRRKLRWLRPELKPLRNLVGRQQRQLFNLET